MFFKLEVASKGYVGFFSVFLASFCFVWLFLFSNIYVLVALVCYLCVEVSCIELDGLGF